MKLIGLIAAAALLFPLSARAHCDGLDGPVVTAARQALEKGDPGLALPWVQAKDEAEVRAAFAQALAVRKLGPEAKALADRSFFETLVRLHRAGEGAPYTGLKPAGRDLGPAIPAADAALAKGDLAAVEKLLTDTALAGARERFAHALALRKQAKGDVAAGRRYVAAYVDYLHYVEGLYEAAARHPGEHAAGSAAHAEPGED